MRFRILFVPLFGFLAGVALVLALLQVPAAEAKPSPVTFPGFGAPTPLARLIAEFSAQEGDVRVVFDPLATADVSALSPTGRMVEVVFPRPPPPRAPDPGICSADVDLPLYRAWVRTLRDSPRPRRAQLYLADLKKIFADAGLPEALAWLAEAESGFDPRALNASGARGLFQLMPYIAREQGLRLYPHDERDNPHKNARAAAAHLRQLYGKFDSWSLALAAYNGGEGCVRRSLQAADARTFGAIARALPSETREYVAKVLATLAVREDLDAGELDRFLGH